MSRDEPPGARSATAAARAGGRGLYAGSVVSLALAGAVLGLAAWAWLLFDREAYEAAMKPPVAAADVPPAPESGTPRTEADTVAMAGDKNVPGAERTAAKPVERSMDIRRTAEPAAPPPSPPEEGEPTPAARSDPVPAGPEEPPPAAAPGGREPWRLHARPFETADPKIPMVALVIAGLGLSQAATETAIQQLPGAVTLAFAPYARNLEDWVAQARAAGHEVLLEVPMEPLDYPATDPGPHTLLTALRPDENLTRLDWLLGRSAGYVGVTNFIGAKFTASADAMAPVLAELGDRGLLYLDGGASGNGVASDLAGELALPSVASDGFIDGQASRTAIDARLLELEGIAGSAGRAVGVGFPYPVTIERVSAWARALGTRRRALAPLSAVVTGALRK